LDNAGALPWDLRAWSGIDALRDVNAHIRAVLHGETGEIAVALITGARGGISEELNQAMRDSGLAHILSISGLHMVIMAGNRVLTRAGAARVCSALALRFPIKEAWPLKAMGFGIDLMVDAGIWVASWPGAVSVFPAISGAALVLLVLGGLCFCLWRTNARAFGLVMAALGLALAPASKRPDVLIDRNGATAALRSDSCGLQR
jgi:Competence protein